MTDRNTLSQLAEGTQTGVAAGVKLLPWTPLVVLASLYYRLRYGEWIHQHVADAIGAVEQR